MRYLKIFRVMHVINKVFVVVVACGLIACVPKRKFDDLNTKYQMEKEQRAETNKKLGEVESNLNELLKKRTEEEKRMEALVRDTSVQGMSLRQLTRNYDQLDKTYRELLEIQEKVKKGSQAEAQRLLVEVEQTRLDLQNKEEELNRIQLSLKDKESRLANLKKEFEAREQKVKELQSIVNKQDSASKALRNKLQAALMGFQDKGLTVTMRNGKVYVSLENELMFQSGSWEVGAQGRQALKQLADVLKENPDINIMVEGHTDIDKFIGRGDLKDNWDLSVKRATEIVKILEINKVNPKAITAAGRGEHVPLDPADTKEAKKKNRRTEIILTPKLDVLMDLLDK
jgi:chemotaxis protein MotB